MESRPKIKIELTGADKTIELIGWLALLIVWVLTITSYSNLPDTIPIHYNAAGQVDGFGNKLNILALPIIATIFYVGLTILNQFPHIFYYPTRINKDNALGQYTNATRMTRYIKLVFVVIFGFLVYKTIHSTGGLPDWFLPYALGLIFIPLTLYLVKSLKMKQ